MVGAFDESFRKTVSHDGRFEPPCGHVRPPVLRAAERAAVIPSSGQKQPENGVLVKGRTKTGKTARNEENPIVSGVSLSSEGGTRTRDPRLMKPVL